MNLDSLNRWLTLVANIGVLIGIIVVVLELQQTQMAMQGEASTMRSQVATEIALNQVDLRIHELREKLQAGETLTPEEEIRARADLTATLRHLENMHYQYQIGILDEEIWEANLGGLGDICTFPLFQYLHPDWGNSSGFGFRRSFRELVSEPCK